MIIKVLDLALIIGLSFTSGILIGIFIMFKNFINIYSDASRNPTPEEPTIVTACPANTLRSEEIIIRK